jgi:sRNA-binding regulator protein Hfq
MSDQPYFAPRKPFVKKPAAPKGHEAFVKALEQAGAIVRLVTLAGETIKGTIHAADKFTISVKKTAADGSYQTTVYFKHALESFETNPNIDAKVAE